MNPSPDSNPWLHLYGARRRVIACATVIEEMLPLLPDDVPHEVLDFGLHLRPDELKRALQQKIDEAANQVEERKNEIQNILAKPKEESKMPTIQVQDVIFSGTLVEGCYSSLQLQDSIRKVIIREHKITHLNPQGHPITEWSMKVAGKA